MERRARAPAAQRRTPAALQWRRRPTSLGDPRGRVAAWRGRRAWRRWRPPRRGVARRRGAAGTLLGFVAGGRRHRPPKCCCLPPFKLLLVNAATAAAYAVHMPHLVLPTPLPWALMSPRQSPAALFGAGCPHLRRQRRALPRPAAPRRDSASCGSAAGSTSAATKSTSAADESSSAASKSSSASTSPPTAAPARTKAATTTSRVWRIGKS